MRRILDLDSLEKDKIIPISWGDWSIPGLITYSNINSLMTLSRIQTENLIVSVLYSVASKYNARGKKLELDGRKASIEVEGVCVHPIFSEDYIKHEITLTRYGL